MVLIDADALLKKILSLTITATGLRAGKRVLLELLVEYRDAILQVVKEQPTVDAVPVVRCKDCKYSYGKKYCTNDAWKDEGNTVYIEPDAFCSYGERKNNE